MELYFVRHAIAAERAPDEDDAARTLTAEGIERMQGAAQALRRLKITPDLLMTSPYVRAAHTAEIIAAELQIAIRVSEKLVPGCDMSALAEILGPYRAAQRVMLVGHEPDFSELIGVLTGGRVEMKKGSIARVDLSSIGPLTGVLAWLLPPKILRELGSK